MEIYGADFSGAKDASKGIYYTKGILEGSSLTIEEVRHCDDRLDLFAAIVNTDSPWGLDFPFAVSREAYERLDLKDWDDLLNLAVSHTRKSFLDYIDEKVPEGVEGRCRKGIFGCRQTDIISNSYSPLKRYNPIMRAMVYGGWKLLAYLRRAGARVYPFDEYDPHKPRVYEVYPSHTWSEAGRRSWRTLESWMEDFAPLEVSLGPGATVENQDAADSVMACITTAVAVRGGIEEDWKTMPDNTKEKEGGVGNREGVIVRV
jgi:predicted nuclease with RNAse H fold